MFDKADVLDGMSAVDVLGAVVDKGADALDALGVVEVLGEVGVCGEMWGCLVRLGEV